MTSSTERSFIPRNQWSGAPLSKTSLRRDFSRTRELLRLCDAAVQSNDLELLRDLLPDLGGAQHAVTMYLEDRGYNDLP